MWVVQVKTVPYVFEINLYSLRDKGIQMAVLACELCSYIVNLHMHNVSLHI